MNPTIQRAQAKKIRQPKPVLVQGRVDRESHLIMSEILRKKKIGWAEFIRAAVEIAIEDDNSRTMTRAVARQTLEQSGAGMPADGAEEQSEPS